MSEGLSHQHLTSDMDTLTPAHRLGPLAKRTTNRARWPNAISALGNAPIKIHPDAGEFGNLRTGCGRRAEGLAEGLLLGDEGTLTECNTTSKFDHTRPTT